MFKIFILKNNILGSYLVQFCIMFTPIILLPILSRGMGNDDFGLLLYLQSICFLGSVIIEFGFNITAPRLIHEEVTNKSHIFYAKILLSIINIFISFSLFFLSEVDVDFKIKVLCIIYGCFSGLNFYWYFLSIERLIFNSMIEFLSSVITILLVLYGKKYNVLSLNFVLSVYAFTKIVSFVLGFSKFFNDKNIELPSFYKAIDILKYSINAFVFRASGSLYTIVNGYLIGTFLGVTSAAVYIQSERLVKAIFMGMIVPFNSGLYPRLIKANINRLSYIVFVFLLSCALVFIQVSLSKYLLNIFYKDVTDELISVFRLFSFILPIIAMTNTFCYLYIFPKRKEHVLSKVLLAVGCINLASLKAILDYSGTFGGVLFNIFLEISVFCFVLYISSVNKYE